MLLAVEGIMCAALLPSFGVVGDEHAVGMWLGGGVDCMVTVQLISCCMCSKWVTVGRAGSDASLLDVTLFVSVLHCTMDSHCSNHLAPNTLELLHKG